MIGPIAAPVGLRPPSQAGRGFLPPSVVRPRSLTDMAQEWIDPRYAELVAAWKRSQLPVSRDPEEPRPRRMFQVPSEG